MKVFVNRELTSSDVEKIQNLCDLEYIPRTNNHLNHTIVQTEFNLAVQLDISHNICEIVLPGTYSQQNLFKDHFLSYVLTFLRDSIKAGNSVRLANEIGYKIFFYAAETSPAAEAKWWDLENKYTFHRALKTETETILGTRLKNYNVRYILQIHLDDQYSIVKVPISVVSTVSVVSTPTGQVVNNPFEFGGFGPNVNSANPGTNNTFGTNNGTNNTFGTNNGTNGTNNAFGTNSNTGTNNTFGTNSNTGTNNTFGSNSNTGTQGFGTNNPFGSNSNSGTQAFGTNNTFGTNNETNSNIGTNNSNSGTQGFVFGEQNPGGNSWETKKPTEGLWGNKTIENKNPFMNNKADNVFGNFGRF
tara:strand:- start:237 stop:1310 length:1074 start_codon:yes stop_codon:yes gene_type:complete